MAGDKVREAARRDLAGRARRSSRPLVRGDVRIAAGLQAARGVRMTLVLAAGELLSLRVRRRPHRVVCLAGQVWATEERCSADFLLKAGERRVFDARGTVVVQALRTSTVQVECPHPARVAFAEALRPALLRG
jgi:hypothetical protein